MDKEKVEQLKIQMQQWLNEAEEFINHIPPVQLYTAVGVVLFTLILLLIKTKSIIQNNNSNNYTIPSVIPQVKPGKVRLFKRTTSNTIILTGLSGSGKTYLFYQLRDGSAHQGTVTSMEPNEDSFILHSEKDKKGKLKLVHIVDVPGHSRLRPKLDEFLPQAAGVVFVVDSVEFLPNFRPASEYLYEILTKASVVKKKVPVLLLCNKVDKVTAHTAEFIRKQLEKEIDKLRTSRTAVSDADISNEYTLGVPGEPFAFSQCHNSIIIAEASGLTGEISQLEKFIRENVKP
ncbi:signal recognition particle receptor subunit beta-like isoform X1 [Solanum pennellii]|uniref:Signal recognition particle receptor subunit beta n=1 Tax=Solanum pennellii TaxID=28526 RepID=A0ABM1UZ22_SOLPN|nr:signal recognition particle receptor subunit beta-like isoform X1 [Solanum pennellii]XP_027768739.1 signal recognition particle receptor subunit beta-like isoform X1 [Solanum pennellii]XP_027768740.1 signal recognition particle receptor subunit beta-like isoform X1 [Solanum pennellii]XP_027768741.1 signal recognition particle receptor subunit beta-like isoform X1 [Solanum pennellii]XP_027768742.1 signal recognition particle receptor subunit beta-like isoform X1 [Solanum pennellii]XP_0277687